MNGSIQKRKVRILHSFSHVSHTQFLPFCPVHAAVYTLNTFEEAPQFLRMRYIHKYYRCHFSKWLCVKSALCYHNQTVNIWSHALSVIVALFFFPKAYFDVSEVVAVGTWESYVHVAVWVIYVVE